MLTITNRELLVPVIQGPVLLLGVQLLVVFVIIIVHLHYLISHNDYISYVSQEMKTIMILKKHCVLQIVDQPGTGCIPRYRLNQ